MRLLYRTDLLVRFRNCVLHFMCLNLLVLEIHHAR
jgi:hypothetical protein